MKQRSILEAKAILGVLIIEGEHNFPSQAIRRKYIYILLQNATCDST